MKNGARFANRFFRVKNFPGIPFGASVALDHWGSCWRKAKIWYSGGADNMQGFVVPASFLRRDPAGVPKLMAEREAAGQKTLKLRRGQRLELNRGEQYAKP